MAYFTLAGVIKELEKMAEPKKDCHSCGNRCMDMEMDPYCAAPKVLESMPYGQTLVRKRPSECSGEGGSDYKLWVEDTRGRK